MELIIDDPIDFSYIPPPEITELFKRLDEEAKRLGMSVAERIVTRIYPERFWDAAYNYNPLSSNGTSGTISDLQKFLTMGLPPITLGTIKGGGILKLQPAVGVLPAIEYDFEPPHGYAITDAVALSYTDDHPSAETSTMASRALSDDLKRNYTIKVGEDDRLRRVSALGWVLQETSGKWRRNGHVLVMDMDERRPRRQPWLILASSWPGYHDGTYDEDFNDYAAEIVALNDSSAAGVLPGDRNRTSIGMIQPMSAGSDEPVLKQFGEDFQFEVKRFGGDFDAVHNAFGPALVDVMDWRWDSERRQEVCYMRNGLEYMRFDREKQEYSYLDFGPEGSVELGVESRFAP